MPKPSSPFVKVTFTNKEQILKALEHLIQEWIQKHTELEQVILFGSFARGDYFPGSDVDVLIILKESDQRFLDRIATFLPYSFPVGLDAFPYTTDEVERLAEDPHSLVSQALVEGKQLYLEPGKGERGETLMHIYIPQHQDFWFDNAIENLHRMLSNLPSTVVKSSLTPTSLFIDIIDRERFVDLFEEQIVDGLDRVIFIQESDKKSGEIRVIKKDFVLVQYDKSKVSQSWRQQERLYDFYNMRDRKWLLSETLRVLAAEGGKYRCIPCSRSFGTKARDKLTNLKQAVYPGVTKNASLSGVRDQQENYTEVCPACYLLGCLEWTDPGVIYRTFVSDGFSVILYPQVQDLEYLHSLKKRYASTFLNNSKRYSNIRVSSMQDDVENPYGEFSTLLCFYEKLVRYAGLTMDWKTFTQNDLCTEWIYLKIPLGQVKNVSMDDINLKTDSLRVVFNLLKMDDQVYQDCLNKIVFQRPSHIGYVIDWDQTRMVREQLSEAFLEEDFRQFARAMLPRKHGFFQIGKRASEILDALVKEWRCSMNQHPARISPEDLEVIRGTGHIIGKISQKHVNILFKIDKARTPLEFTDALREAGRRMYALEDREYARHTFAPSKLEELVRLFKEKEANWEEIRNLLVVYTCIALSREKMSHMGTVQVNTEVAS